MATRKVVIAAALCAASVAANGAPHDETDILLDKMTQEEVKAISNFVSGSFKADKEDEAKTKSDWEYYVGLLSGWKEFEECKPCLKDCMAMYDYDGAQKSFGTIGKWSGAVYHLYNCAMDDCHCLSDKTWHTIANGGKVEEDTEEEPAEEDVEEDPEASPEEPKTSPEEPKTSPLSIRKHHKINFSPQEAPAIMETEMEAAVTQEFEKCKPCFAKCMENTGVTEAIDPTAAILGSIECLTQCKCFDDETLEKYWESEEDAPQLAVLPLNSFAVVPAATKEEKAVTEAPKQKTYKDYFMDAVEEWKELSKCRPCFDKCLKDAGYSVKDPKDSWLSFLGGYSMTTGYCLVTCECVTYDRYKECIDQISKYMSSSNDEEDSSSASLEAEDANAEEEEEFFDAPSQVDENEGDLIKVA